MSTSRPSQRRRRRLLALAVVLFGFALGTLSVVVPLRGVDAGFSPSDIGLLVAAAAVAQLGTRLGMGALLRRFPDRSLLAVSGALIAVSCVLLSLSAALWVFITAQVIQGAARAFFWTSSQTHAVRSSVSAVGGLRDVNLSGGLGALLGPAVAGWLWGASIQLPLLVAAAAGTLAVVPTVLLERHPPFAGKPTPSGGADVQVRLWRRPGMLAACWMNTGAGAWKSLLDSYVPLALSLAGQPAAVIGLLLSVANATVLAGSAASGWIHGCGTRAAMAAGMLPLGVGLAAVGPFAGLTHISLTALAFSGIGAGVLQTIGPAIAAERVHPEERGDALALTGVLRSTALFLTPVGMAGLVVLAPVPVALLVAGLLLTTPAASPWRERQRCARDMR